MSLVAPQTFLDPETDLEYIRVPASDLDDGDVLDNTQENLSDLGFSRLPEAYVRSQNGYTCGRLYVASYTIPGTTTRMALRKGDVATVLLDFFGWYDKAIESIDGGQLDDWGFAERPIRGYDDVYSNHFSGTAGDVNALQHPLGVQGTLTGAQKDKIRRKLAEYRGVIRAGFDYTRRVDPMHYEIDKAPDLVHIQAVRIRNRNHNPNIDWDAQVGDRVLGLKDPPMVGHDVEAVIHALRVIGNHDIPQGTVYTQQVALRINVFKDRHGVREVGCGPLTIAELRRSLRRLT